MTTYPNHYTDIDFGLALFFIVLGAIFLLIVIVLIFVFQAEGAKYRKRVGMLAIHPDATIGRITESQGRDFDKSDPFAYEDGLSEDGHFSPYGRTEN